MEGNTGTSIGVIIKPEEHVDMVVIYKWTTQGMDWDRESW